VSTTAYFQASVTGLTTGRKDVSVNWTNATNIDAITDLTIGGAGDTAAITVPAGSRGIVITPPSTNTQTLKLKNSADAGDVGISIDPAAPTVVAVAATGPIADFKIRAGGAVTGFVVISFF
jgi:hypothetical protein